MRTGIVSSLALLLVFGGVVRAQYARTQVPGDPGTPEPPKTLSVADSPAPPAPPGPPEAKPSAAPHTNCSSCLLDDCCDEPPCGPPGRLWASGEYLLWWTRDARFPPLVTTSPITSAGILGQPGTVVLFDSSDNDVQHGGRFTVGFWLNDCRTCGVEASYFFLDDRSTNFFLDCTDPNSTVVVARPFFNDLTGQADSQLICFPGVVSGRLGIDFSSFLQGAEVNGIWNLRCCGDWCGCDGGYRIDLLAGFRYLQLDEELEIREELFVDPDIAVIGGSQFLITDRFETRNRFYGGQIGIRGEVARNRFFANLTAKLALGGTDAEIEIAGSSVITPAGGPTVVREGGILALSSNSGQFNRSRFAIVPEVNFNVGYQVTDHFRAFVGYTFLYWSDVYRPDDQIDLVIDPLLIPTTVTTALASEARRPVPLLKETDFWAQGVNFGLEFRY